MRWEAQVCRQCGGVLDADYADVVLVCLRCNRTEPLPRTPATGQDTAAGGPEAGFPRPEEAAPLTHGLALVDVRPQTRQVIEGVCACQGYQVVPLAGGGPWNRELGGVELLVVESDRGGMAVSLAKELRRRFPATPVAVVLTCWSEAEEEVGAAAEFVLHAPLREAEVAHMLHVMEDYRGWLPAALLASKYRDRLAG